MRAVGDERGIPGKGVGGSRLHGTDVDVVHLELDAGDRDVVRCGGNDGHGRPADGAVCCGNIDGNVGIGLVFANAAAACTIACSLRNK